MWLNLRVDAAALFIWGLLKKIREQGESKSNLQNITLKYNLPRCFHPPKLTGKDVINQRSSEEAESNC